MTPVANPFDPTPGAVDYLAFAQTGEAVALDRALLACADRAYTQARRNLGNAADADDAVQEAFLQLARTARRFDGSVPFSAWVGRLVQIACLRLRRSNRRRQRREEVAMAFPCPAPGPDDLSETVRAQVARLSEADRTVIDLHYFAGLSQADVAAALGSSENAVALRLSRARNRLRALLGGSTTTASVALLLAMQPVHAASPTVLAGIGPLSAAITAGGGLPATTIPLSLSQKGMMFMSLHPIVTVSCAGLLLVGGLLPAVVWSADPPIPPHTEVQPAPVKSAVASAWAGSEREILRWLVPKAPLRVAADLTALRRLAATTKPTSLLFDPQVRPALDRLCERLAVGQLASLEGDIPVGNSLGFVTSLVAEGRAGAVSFGDDGGLGMFEVGGQARADIQQRLAFLSANEKYPAAERAGFTGWQPTVTDWQPTATGVQPTVAVSQDFLGVRGDLLAGGRARLLVERAQDGGMAPAPDLPAPAWAAADFTALVAAYASADTTHSDPLDLGWFLGTDWRSLKPHLAVTLEVETSIWVMHSRVTRAVPFSPLALAAVNPGIIGHGGKLVALPKRLLRRADPAKLPPLRPGALATLTFGSTAGWLRALVDSAGNPKVVALRNLPGAASLIDAWSGDLTAVVEPGAPLPTCTVVLGLRQALDPAQVTQVINAIVPLASIARPPGTQAAWQGFSPAGMVTVLLAEGRLVVSTAPDAIAFLASASQAPAAELTLCADLPRLAVAYAPLAYSQVSIPLGKGRMLDATCLPPIPVLVRHLVPWTLTWSETSDGCVVREEGLPVLGSVLAVVAGKVLTGSVPAYETAEALDTRGLPEALLAHRERLAAIAKLREALLTGAALTAAERGVLRPFFAGQVPNAAQVRSFGTRYDFPKTKKTTNYPFSPEDLAAGLAKIRLPLTAMDVQIGFTSRTNYGYIDWAMPLGDGWSIVIIGEQVGLMRRDPPVKPIPTPPTSGF